MQTNQPSKEGENVPQAKGAAFGEAGQVRSSASLKNGKASVTRMRWVSKQVRGEWGEMWLEWEAGPGLGTWPGLVTLGHQPLPGYGSEPLPSQGHSRLPSPLWVNRSLILSHLSGDLALIPEAQRGRVTYLLQSTSQSLGGVLGPLVNCDLNSWFIPRICPCQGVRARISPNMPRSNWPWIWSGTTANLFLEEHNESSLSRVWLFWDPMDCSLAGSSIHGTSQVRILEWVATLFSRKSSQPRDWSSISCIGR